MKVSYKQFQELLPELQWDINELAEKLSLAGHETEAVGNDQLDISLTANRRDCQDVAYLVFDLAGVYDLKIIPEIIKFGHSNPISMSAEQVNKILGSDITFDDLKKLEQLGFKVERDSVRPPDFRDVVTAADVAEEVVRQLGYDKLNIQPLPRQDIAESNTYQHILAVKMALANIGLTETSTSSFARDGVSEIKDPFSHDEPYLRPNLLIGLLKIIARNPYLKRAAFFEIGNVFTPAESTKLGIIIAGYKDIESWQSIISQTLGQSIHFGEVDLAIAAKQGVKQGRLNFLELSTEGLKPLAVEPQRSLELPLPNFQPISKFPPLVRDVTIENPTEEILETLRGLEGILLVEAVDKYQDSVTYRLIFQKMTGSYTETEIQAIDNSLRSFQNN